MTRPSFADYGTHDESAFPELWEGVVGAWAPCLGPTGSRLHDMSRRSNWGTLTNMDPPTDWVVDGGQYALDFDGSNDFVDTTNRAVVRQFTYSAWFKVAGGQRQFERVADAVYTTTMTGVTGWTICRIASNANQWGCYYVANGTVLTPVQITLQDGQWHHIAAVRLGTQLTVYGNGGSVRSTGTITDDTTSGEILRIARSSTAAADNYFAGQMDDHIYWNRALSAAEINQLYQLGRGGMYQRRRRTRKVSVQVGNAIWLKTGGVWKETTPWIKVGGIWKQASPNIKISGVWE